MLHNKYIMAGALCLSALMQAASESGTGIKLTDCFVPEGLSSISKDLRYKSVMLSKRYMEMSQDVLGRRIDFVGDEEKCSGIMGFVGLVEGSDHELVTETAAQIEGIATRHQWGSSPVFEKADEFAKHYLDNALRAVIKCDIERFKRTRDVSLRLVWFRSENNLPWCRRAVEIGQGGAAWKPLRPIIVPACVEADLKSIELCHDETASLSVRLATLAKFVESSPSHAASGLRFVPEQYERFLCQQFADGTN